MAVPDMALSPTLDHAQWLASLPDHLRRFLNSLQVKTGRFLPAAQGVTPQGEKIALGFSCFALKIYYMLGWWEELTESERTDWIRFIQGYQVNGNPLWLSTGRDAFIDPPLLQGVASLTSRRQRLKDRIFYPNKLNRVQRMISGETKQAIASLAQVGANSLRPYRGFPTTEQAMREYLNHLNWSQPWEAGAHTATIAVYLETEAPRFLSAEQTAALHQICADFVATLADKTTGAYFRGATPGYDQRVNGAMKILTALDWLHVPVHYPEKLIDTCLSQQPQKEGCHLVDAVYVLYRCQQQTDYRKSDIEKYSYQLLEMVRPHFNPADGGFSYHVGRSQTHSHSVPITQGMPVSDIHGTILLTWALAMLVNMLNIDSVQWCIITP